MPFCTRMRPSDDIEAPTRPTRGRPRERQVPLMENLYKRFCEEGYNEQGTLTKFSIHCPETFNFAYDVVDEIARIDPDRPALVWCNVAGDERRFTFREMQDLSNQTANFLRQAGIGQGDRVMLMLKRHYEYWYTILALHKLGAVAVPATHMLTVKDIVYRVQSASIKAVICTPEGHVADYVEQAQQECPTLTVKVIARQPRKGFLFLDEIAEESAAWERVPTRSTDPLLMYFTSGTTGYPKAVIHDHTYPLAHIITAKHWQNVQEGGLHLTVADTGWGKASWGKLYGQWLAGTAVMVYDFDKFVAADLMAVIEKYRVTTFCAPPTIYRFLIKEGMGHYNLSSLQYATNAGEALNYEVYKQFLEHTGIHLMEGFGQTETTLLVANLVGSETKPGSMGKPSPLYDVFLADAQGQEVAPGEVGEIVVRPCKDGRQYGIFSAYNQDDALYQKVWRGGVYHTGDTAYRDEDGYYWYVGRMDDIIKSSGYRIGPFEIESVLMEHPAVLECAITGVPDPERGQVVKATIVLTSSYRPSDELARELQQYVKKATAPYKYPRVVEFVPELPKTISGKIRRVEIRHKDAEKQG